VIRSHWWLLAVLLLGVCFWTRTVVASPVPQLRAGVAVVDISPQQFPAIVSGGFFERTADRLQDPLHARALVLDDGTTRLALVVVDNLMMSRELIDQAKQAASRATGIPVERMMVSATHSHCAPSVMGALGTGVDEPYAQRLPGWIAEAIQRAAAKLVPVRVGWAMVDDPQHTHCRRWILRPDKVGLDPFGQRTVRAMMHPGYQNPDYLGPAGPVDTGLSVVAFQMTEGRPLAVLANYSMHYFGWKPISADYFGLFCEKLAAKIAAPAGPTPTVIMAQGTAGDLHWMDYSRPKVNLDMNTYCDQVVEVAAKAFRSVRYQPSATLAMAERRLTLRRRVADPQRLTWARQIVAAMAGAKPKTKEQLYALEQVLIAAEPQRELKLQAIRIGEVGITAIPCEVFGITGLKLKAQSPLVPTVNIELANGGEGYIPPPSQHKLGGYTTWAARTAALEVQAEPRIVETVLELLEQVAGRARRQPADTAGTYAVAVRAAKPVAYWRLEDFEGPTVRDAMGRYPARFTGGVAYYLDGPQQPGLAPPGQINRAVHLAGGWMECPELPASAGWTGELWFWNGLPIDLRPVTGCLFSRGPRRLEIGGTSGDAGRLVYIDGPRRTAGRTPIAPQTWNHLVVTRTANRLVVYLNGREELATSTSPAPRAPLRIGTCGQAASTFEGKIDEVAIYDRALTAAEARQHAR
jgi:hypothetical protein